MDGMLKRLCQNTEVHMIKMIISVPLIKNKVSYKQDVISAKMEILSVGEKFFKLQCFGEQN